MVYLKHHRQWKNTVLTNNNTDPFILPESGILSAIQLDFQAINASGLISLIKQRIIDHMTAIEITDGGTNKMFSLTGQELKALDFYQLGRVMPETAILYDTNYQRTTCLIPFGEYIGDPKHALDLSAFDQVNLELTNDYTTSYVAANNFTCDIKLLTIEDLAAPPAGYYKSYEWAANAPAASGQYVYHKIPTTDKIRRLMTQFDPTVVSATAIPEDVTSSSNNIKLYFNQRTQTVLDHPPKQLWWENAVMYGKPVSYGRYPQSTTVYADSTIGRVTNMPYGDLNQANSAPTTSHSPLSQENNNRFFLMDNVTAVSSGQLNSMVDAMAVGEGYYNTAVIFDSYGPDENMFLDPSKSGKGPVEIEWLAGSGAAHKLRTFLTVPKKQGQA